MARASLDPHRRDRAPGSLLPISDIARRQDPERAHLSRLSGRRGTGHRRARARHRPRQASGTTIVARVTSRADSPVVALELRLIVTRGTAPRRLGHTRTATYSEMTNVLVPFYS